MSASAFSKELRGKVSKIISDRLLKTRDTGTHPQRTQLNKKIHVLEISPEILMDTRALEETVTKDTYYNPKHNIDEATIVFDKVKNEILHHTGNIRKYNASAKEDSAQMKDLNGTSGTVYIYYIEGDDKKLVLLTRNFDQMYKRVVSVVRKITNTPLDVGHTAGFLGSDNTPNALKTANVAATRMREAIDVSFEKNLISPKTRSILNKLNMEFYERYKEAHIKYNASFDKDISLANNKLGAAIDMVLVFPQHHQVNRNILADIEKALIKEFEYYLEHGEGSKPVRQTMNEQLTDLFMGNKPKKSKTKAKASGKIKDKNKRKEKSVDIVSHTAKIKIPPVQETNGRFVSVANLRALLQPLVTLLVGEDMQRAAYFKKDTGNFTKGVLLTDVTRTGDTGINVNFNYESSRYGSFEGGGRHHRAGREPSSIISLAIREAAIKLVHKKFRVTPVWSSFKWVEEIKYQNH